jgi:hypothetical protein
MSSTTPPQTVPWQYADWRRFPTRAEQRARLVLHLEEIAALALDMQNRGRSLSLQAGYREDMERQLDRLDRKIAVARGSQGRTGVSQFQRGAGP